MNIPESTKIIDLGQARSRVYSVQEIRNQVNLVKNWASALGNKRIGIVAKNSFDFAMAWLGIRQTSCVTVLINPKLSPDRLESCLKSCDLILTDSDLSVDVPTMDISQCRSTNFSQQNILDPERDSLILYTSGFAGTPKAVVYSYKDIEHHVHRSYKSRQVGLRTMCCNPFFHLAGLFWLNHNINNGNHLFLMDKFDPAVMLSAIQQYRIQAITAVPPIMQKLMACVGDQQTFDSVIAVNLPSAPLRADIIEQIKQRFPALEYFKNPYGLTETGVSVFNEHDTLPTPLGSVGVVGDQETQLIDHVLYIKTKHLRSQLKHSSDEWFCTGDRFSVDQDGFYYYLGRADNMFKVNGEKVYPEHVESVIHKFVKDLAVCVIGIEHDTKGHEPVVVIESEVAPDKNQLLTHCRQYLTSYEIPSQIFLVKQFPLTASGKIDRKQLYTYIKNHVASSH
jgi:long-chain acyl-CoA synthetase